MKMLNLIDCIDSNIFLKKLFPNGITNNEVMIGKFSIDLSMNCDLHFHVRQKPDIEVHKFGTWGKDYNIVVIRILGAISEEAQIQNWRSTDFQELKIVKNEDNYILSTSNEKFNFSVMIKWLTFQSISVYLDSPDE